jgi:bifunctional N-acetylglucosamine-1-phosphate-uridyltransferase/glucosamine-1-phosphate-acetyltransferase GlmU-like protein
MECLKPDSFFDLTHFAHRDLFAGCNYTWEALSNISGYLDKRLEPNVRSLGCFMRPLPRMIVMWRGEVLDSGFEIIGGDVSKGKFRVRIGGEETGEAAVLCEGSVLWDEAIFIGPGAVLEPGALVKGPTIIGAQTEVRQGAYIRGKCIIGDRCVVGHTSEMKGSVMVDGAKAGHFAYIGDSILGKDSNLGAGTKLANLKINNQTIRVTVHGSHIDTKLRKFGAIIGDKVEIGCNTVTNPGTMLGKNCQVFALTSVRAGYYEPDSIIRA